MYPKDLERLRIEIHDIIETHCHVCPKNEMAQRTKNNQKNEHCIGCSILTDLERLGLMLTPNDQKHKQQKIVPFSRFVELFEKGELMQKEIAILLNVSTKTVTARKKQWKKDKGV